MAIIEQAIPLGGASLNFEVVGGTVQPNNPKENTIWVNTATEITSWVFSANAPDYLATGGVWIKTSDSSATPFDALKKNGIMVYPQNAHQWDGAEWVSREVYVYKAGEWLMPRFLYLAYGDSCSSVTGGWTQVSYESGAYQPGILDENGMTLNGSGYVCRHFGTVNPIDLSAVSTLYFKVPSISVGTNTGGYSADRTLSMGANTTRKVTYTDSNKQGWSAEYFIDTPSAVTDALYPLDVSNLSGEYYLLVQLTCGGNNTQTVVISEIYGV